MYQRILVPVDGSTPSTLGLREAIKLAKGSGVKLRLLHVINDVPIVRGSVYTADLRLNLREQGEAVLREASGLAGADGVEAETAIVDSAGGLAGDLIVEDAERWGADLIVLGTHGRRGLRRLLMGSDAECAVRRTPVPTLLVRDRAAHA